jgi:hypothetical protein
MDKVCSTCKVPKQLTDENYRTTKGKNGRIYFRGSCRECEIYQHLDWQKRSITVVMYNSARQRAKRDNVPCTITAHDIIIPKFCPVFGLELRAGDRYSHENSPSLDRIIPERGYVQGNIRVISHLANMLKSKATSAQLRALADYIDGIQPSIIT